MIKRMRHMKTRLLAIRLGPGAALLPKEIERIHLDFAPLINDGHRGPRKFWRHMLPRLKYHNPGVLMSVSRTQEQTGPAIMSIYMKRAGATATTTTTTSEGTTEGEASQDTQAASEATGESLPSDSLPTGPLQPLRKLQEAVKTTIPKARADQEVLELDMKHKSEDEILSAFLQATRAREVQPTQGELDDLRELEEFRDRSLRDSTRSKGVRAAWKREQEMLKAAKGELTTAS